MLISFTIGWGIATFLAAVLMWVALALWPRKPDVSDLMGIGGAVDGFLRFVGGLVGTILLMALYIGLKLGGVC